MVAHRMFGQTAGAAVAYVCQVNQAGYWNGVTINPGPPWTESSPGSVSRTQNRLVIQFVGSTSLEARVHSKYHWWRSHTLDTPGFPGPNTMTPQPPNEKAPGVSRSFALPDPPGHWALPMVPFVTKPGQVLPQYAPRPLRAPVRRPEPWSPEAPDVGPRPAPRPRPNESPAYEPVPDEVPRDLPEFRWEPQPITHVRGSTYGKHWSRVRPEEKRARRPPKGTRERKARWKPWMGYLWQAFGQVTEGVDTVKYSYECLPKRLKVDLYKQLGRQPSVQEKAMAVYRNVNSLDVGCMITSYISEKIEDRLYSLGSDQIAKANRDLNRPIGFEAGGGLTGNRPYVSIGPV